MFEKYGSSKISKKEFLSKLVRALKLFDSHIKLSKFRREGYKIGIVFPDYTALFGDTLGDYIEGDYFKLYEDYNVNIRTDFKIVYVKCDVEDVVEEDMTSTRSNHFSEMLVSCFEHVFVSHVVKLEKPTGSLDNLYLQPHPRHDYTQLLFFDGEKLQNFFKQDAVLAADAAAHGKSFKLAVLNRIKQEARLDNFGLIRLKNTFRRRPYVVALDSGNTNNLLLEEIDGVVYVVAELNINMGDYKINRIGSARVVPDFLGIKVVNPDFPIKLLNHSIHRHGYIMDETRRMCIEHYNSRSFSTFINSDNLSYLSVAYLTPHKSKYSERYILLHSLITIPRQDPYVVDAQGNYAFVSEIKEVGLADLLGYKMFKKRGENFFKFKDIAEVNVDKRDGNLHEIKTVMGYGRNLSKLIFVDRDGECSSAKQDTLYLGPEFEFDEGGQSDRNAEVFLSALTNYNPYAWVTRDGSLSNGFEGKTQPSTLEAHMDPEIFDYKLAFDTLKKLGYSGFRNDTCGLHVHVNKDFFRGARQGSDSSHYALGILASLLENNWQSIVNFSRRVRSEAIDRWAANRRALPVMLEEFNSSDKSNFKARSVLKKLSSNNYMDRRSAVHGGKSETFEFRLFKGTLDYDSYMATLQFVHNICKVAKMLHESLITGEDNVLTRLLSITFQDIVNHTSFPELNRVAEDIRAYYKD